MSTAADDKEAIRDILARYCHYIDSGRIDEWVGLFTEHGRWDGGKYGKAVGHDQLRKMAAGSAEMRTSGLSHLNLNQLIELDGDSAHVVSYVLAAVGLGEAMRIMAPSFYVDRMIKVSGRWLFESRIVKDQLEN